jgi:hypothetical protein
MLLRLNILNLYGDYDRFKAKAISNSMTLSFCTGEPMCMSWIDMYNQYVKGYEKMNEFYNDYVNKMKMLNELFDEASRNISRMNELYRDLVKVNENMYNLHRQYLDHFQKLNQQWVESLWGPFLAKVQVQEKKEIKTTQEEKKE